MADRYEAAALRPNDSDVGAVADALRAAERRGAESMRGRAAKECDTMRSAARVDAYAWIGAREACAAAIRALPLEVPDAE
jgi:hypothetical protein